jgi:hypothetical protein
VPKLLAILKNSCPKISIYLELFPRQIDVHTPITKQTCHSYFFRALLATKSMEGPLFKTRILKQGNNNTKRLAYMSFARPMLEYGTVCWDPHREWQLSALNRVQSRADTFANHTNESGWEILAQRRMIA